MTANLPATAPAQQLTVLQQICKTVDTMEGQLKEALAGTGIDVKRFVATAKTALQTHPDKEKLEKADRMSIFLAIRKAAGDGLQLDQREAALVVYNTKVKSDTGEKWVPIAQYQPMVQGLVKLARNSGEIQKLGAYIVYENDSFKFEAGRDEIPRHSAPKDEKGNDNWFAPPKDRGKPIGVWAFVQLKNGQYLDPVMLTKERIDRIATRSKVAGNYSPTDGKDWEEWWKKAAIRNILKYAPKSTALERALDDDNEEFDLASESVSYAPPAATTAPAADTMDKPKAETRAAARIKPKEAKEPEQPQEPPQDTQQPQIIDGEVTEVKDGESEEPPV